MNPLVEAFGHNTVLKISDMAATGSINHARFSLLSQSSSLALKPLAQLVWDAVKFVFFQITSKQLDQTYTKLTHNWQLLSLAYGAIGNSLSDPERMAENYLNYLKSLRITEIETLLTEKTLDPALWSSGNLLDLVVFSRVSNITQITDTKVDDLEKLFRQPQKKFEDPEFISMIRLMLINNKPISGATLQNHLSRILDDASPQVFQNVCQILESYCQIDHISGSMITKFTLEHASCPSWRDLLPHLSKVFDVLKKQSLNLFSYFEHSRLQNIRAHDEDAFDIIPELEQARGLFFCDLDKIGRTQDLINSIKHFGVIHGNPDTIRTLKEALDVLPRSEILQNVLLLLKGYHLIALKSKPLNIDDAVKRQDLPWINRMLEEGQQISSRQILSTDIHTIETVIKHNPFKAMKNPEDFFIFVLHLSSLEPTTRRLIQEAISTITANDITKLPENLFHLVAGLQVDYRDALQHLHEVGLDPFRKVNGKTPLHIALEKKNQLAIEQLLSIISTRDPDYFDRAENADLKAAILDI